jgi:hypothetical protein
MRRIGTLALRGVLLLHFASWVWTAVEDKTSFSWKPLPLLGTLTLWLAVVSCWWPGRRAQQLAAASALFYAVATMVLVASVLLMFGTLTLTSATWGPFKVRGAVAPAFLFWGPYSVLAAVSVGVLLLHCRGPGGSEVPPLAERKEAP